MQSALKRQHGRLLLETHTEAAWQEHRCIVFVLLPFALLFPYELFELAIIALQQLSELLPTRHFLKSSVVCFRDMSRFAQILKIFVEFVNTHHLLPYV